ncbi:YadA-like family protein [uncultured Aggregatibacter sp.]|uniref:YadA-like family protein n=1 Tax=uncultured Aggregatibacter sp. TaxID=470564 RepID=UPI0025D2C916|nr:YadA-like family protein [uncultured Aggregatibacter sp.]
MNHIYKSIFNKALGVFTAVPEFASAHGKGSERTVVGRVAKGTAGFAASALAISVGLALTSTSAVAAPGIFINNGQDPACLAVIDDVATSALQLIYGGSKTIYPAVGVAAGSPLGTKTNFELDARNPCLPTGGTGAENYNTQTNRTLFYNSKNLTLGGRLDVNSGIIGVGDRGTDGAGATNSIRMGTGTTLDEANKHTNAIAIGVDTATTAEGAVAISAEAKARTSYSIAIGRNATAGGDMVPPSNETGAAIAIGRNSLSNFIGAVALGNGATVSPAKSGGNATDGIAIGTKALVDSYRGMAIGANSQAKGSQSIVLANNVPGAKLSTASGIRSQVYGVESEVSGSNSVAMGSTNTVASHRTYAIGNNINVAAGADDSLVFGTQANVGARNSIAMGNTAQALAGNSTAIGSGTTAQTGYSTALGYQAQAGDPAVTNFNGEYTTAIGGKAKALHAYTTALGAETNASGAYATAVGNEAKATHESTTAVGKGAKATNDFATAVGQLALASGKNGTAVGTRNEALGEEATALGYHSHANGSQQLSIGAHAGRNLDGSFSQSTHGISIGSLAGADNATAKSNDDSVLIGTESGRYAQGGNRNTSIGKSAGQYLKGSDNIAMGTDAGSGTATDKLEVSRTVAIGNTAKASGNDAIAMGNTANSKTEGAISIGAHTVSGDGDLVPGVTDIGNKSISIGYESVANRYDTIAMGVQASTQAADSGVAPWDAVAIGSKAKATTYKALAIGAYSQATGRQSTVIGNDIQGQNSTASGTRSQILGVQSNVSGDNSVSIGDTNTIASARTYALGNNINAAAGTDDSLAFGTSAAVEGANTIAMGNTAKAHTENSISIGKNSESGKVDKFDGKQSVAIGFEAKSMGTSTIAMGSYATSENGHDGVAIGTYAKTGNEKAITIGAYSSASGAQSIVIANNYNSDNSNNSDKSTATGRRAIVMGAESHATAEQALAIGDKNTVAGARTYAIGNNINVAAGADDSLVFGTRAAVGGANTVAIGANANAAQANSVALGAGSATSAAHTGAYTLNGSYTAAGLPNAANGTVSVGSAGKERQIQNVAAGVISATSTDAINGSQLYATNNYMNNFAGDVKTKLGGNAALGNDGHLTMTNIGGTGENTVDDAIKNLKTAIDNKADTTASVTSENQADIKVDKEAPVGNTTNYKLSLGNDAKAKLAKAATALQTVEGDSNITATKDATDPTKVKLALNKNLTADSVTLGDTTTAEHVVLNKDGLTVGNLGPALSNSGIDMRGGQIGNLVGGAVKSGDRTAVSAGMLYDVAQSVKDAIGGETLLDSDDPTKGLPAGRLTLSNVGETGENTIHDAIKSVNDKAKTAVQEIESANPTALSVKKDGTKVTLTPNFITGDLVNADGTVNAPAAADEGKLVSAKTVADALKANHFVVDTKGNTETGSEADAKVGSGNKVTFEAGNNLVAKQANTANGGATVKFSLKDDISLNSVTAGTGDNQVVLGNDGVKVGGNTYINNDGLNANSKVISNVAAGVKPTDAVNKDQLDAVKNVADSAVKSVDTVASEENLVVDNNDPQNPKLRLKKAVNLTSIKLDGATPGNTTYVSGYGLTIEDGPSVKKEGINAGDKKITNVAAGDVSATSKDAVNGAQLHNVASSVANVLGGNAAVDGNGNVTSSDIGGTGANTVDDAIKAVNATAAKHTTVVEGKNVKVTKGKNAAGGDEYTVATKDDLDVTSVTAGNTTVNTNGLTITGGPSVTRGGIDAGDRVISNVKAGDVSATSKEAVNGSQLYATNTKLDGVKAKADTAVQDVKSGDENALTAVKDPNTNIVTVTPKLSGDLVDANGNITAPTTPAEKGKLVTAGTVAEALANTHFVVDTKATDGELDGASQADQKIKAGNKVTLQAGKNLKAKQTNGTDGAKVEFSLKDSISLTQVTAGTGDNQVVLGNDGVQVGGNTYINKDGLNANNKVISNVADGVNPNDAVNKGQLDAVKGVADSAVKSVDVVANENNLVVDNTDPKNPKLRLRKAVDLDSIKLENNVGEKSFLNSAGLTIKDGPAVTRSGINANNTKVTNVTDGDVNGTSKDAVNGSQLYNVASNVKDLIGPDAAIDPATGKVTVADPTKGIGGTGKGNIGDAIQSVKDAADKAAAEHTTVKAGNNIVVTEGTNAAGGKEYTVSTAKDLNVDSVKAGDTTVNNDGLTIAGGPSVKKDGIDAGDKNITNVADGNVAAGSKDAVNGGQLYDVAKNVADLVGPDATIDPATGKVTVADPTKGIGETGKGTIGDAIKAVNDLAKKAAAEKTSVKAKDGRSNVTVTEGTNAAGGHEYTVDVERAVTEAGSDQVTVTSKHDADSNTTTYTVDVSDKTKASLAKADSAVQGLTSKDGNLNFNKDPNGNVEVSFNDNLNVKNITADGVKAGDTTINSNGIEIVNGPSMTKDGINAGSKAITNVANGNLAKGSTDAVNGGQLHDTAQSVADVIGGGATVKDGKVVAGQNGIGNTGQNTVHGAIAAINQNTANNFNQIRGDLRKMDRDLRGGIAGALATAGLPQAFRPGKSMVAAAASTYRGQSGLAIGVSRISDNGKVILKVTGNTNSRGDFGGTIGAGYQW